MIYRYIPELSEDTLENIIRNKEINNKQNLNYLVNYKKVVMIEYGQDIEEIILMKT